MWSKESCLRPLLCVTYVLQVYAIDIQVYAIDTLKAEGLAEEEVMLAFSTQGNCYCCLRPR